MDGWVEKRGEKGKGWVDGWMHIDEEGVYKASRKE